MQPRRRPSYGSSSSLRRSSVSSRDIAQIQLALSRTRPISNHTVILLLLFIPSFSFFLLYSLYTHHGHLLASLGALFTRWPFFAQCVPPFFDPIAWKMIFVLVSVQLLLYEVLPRDSALILSSTGDTTRQINGFSSTVVVCLSYLLGACLGMYSGDVVYLHLLGLIGCLASLAMAFTISLYAYYRIMDLHAVDNAFDFFFGVELEWRVLDMEAKHWLRSRVCHALHALLSISACFFHRNAFGSLPYSLIGAAAAHLCYVLLWQWGEELQLNGVDAKRVNFGWIRMWGDLVLYPLLYSAPFIVMANQKRPMSIVFSVPLLLGAILFSFLSYRATRERYYFRRCKGNTKIWNRDPYFITAKYRADSGETAASVLLGSGYWGFCRHPNYAFELAAFLCLSLLPGWTGLLSYSSFVFFLVYFLIRIHYDEQRCLIKYGSAWSAHCARVTFRLLPGIY